MLSEGFQKSLRSLRKSQKMTQEELAVIIGVSQQSIYKYEKGLTFPPLEVLEEIMDWFQVDLNALFGLKMENEPLTEEKIMEIVRETIYESIQELEQER